jgi:hypothetical protein
MQIDAKLEIYKILNFIKLVKIIGRIRYRKENFEFG